MTPIDGRWYVEVEQEDQGWDDGDTSWFNVSGTEDACRVVFEAIVNSPEKRIRAARLVQSDGLTDEARWTREPEPPAEPYWSEQVYVPTVGEFSRCKMCGEPRGDHEGITLHCRHEHFERYQALGGYAAQRWSSGHTFTESISDEKICSYCGRPIAMHSASRQACELAVVEADLGIDLVNGPKPAPRPKLHPELQAVVDATKPECARVGYGHYEVTDIVDGSVYHFHDKVTRLFRHGDAILGNKRVGNLNGFLQVISGDRVNPPRPTRSSDV